MLKQHSQINAVALEGAPFSGKTTFLNYLKKHYLNQFNIVPETGEYVGGDKNFPNLPFKNIKDVLYSIFFFSEIEKKRVEDAMRLYEMNSYLVIFDRITPLSSLIFFYLLTQRYLGKMIYNENAVSLAMHYFKNYCDNHTFLLPNKIVYLEPLNDEVFRQRTDRKTHNRVFEDIDSYHLVCDKYKDFLNLAYSGGFIKTIKTQNNKDSLEEILLAIKMLAPLGIQAIDTKRFFSKDIWIKNKKTSKNRIKTCVKKLDILDIKKIAIKRAQSLMVGAGYL